MNRLHHFAKLVAKPFLGIADLEAPAVEVNHDRKLLLGGIGATYIEGQLALYPQGLAANELQILFAGLGAVQ